MNDYDDLDELVVTQYKNPPRWWELVIYLVMFALLCGAALGYQLALVALGAGALYWNYMFFGLFRQYVKAANASNINYLLLQLGSIEKNKHKDGTIPESSGLTKEEGNE